MTTVTENRDGMNISGGTKFFPLPYASYLAIGIYLCILGVLALCGNITVIVIILRKKSGTKKLYNLLLVNMAFADLALTVIVYPLLIAASLRNKWFFGDVVCKMVGFLMFFLSTVTLSTQTFIAIFRYILVCKPSCHHLLTLKTAKPVIAICWGYALLWTSGPLLGWNSFVQEPFLTSCAVNWEDTTAVGISYVVVTLIMCYALPLSLCVACYSLVLKNSFSLTFGAHKATRGSIVPLEEVLWSHKVATERHVTKICLALLVAFLVCWSPYVVVSSMTAGGYSFSKQVYTLPTMFARISCATNPVIYVFMSSKFREALRRVLLKRRDSVRIGSTASPFETQQRDCRSGSRFFRSRANSFALRAQSSIF